MPESPKRSSPFQLGDLRVEPARNVLIRDGVEHHLEPRVMDVLCVLAEEPGEVVPRETLIDRLWVSEFGADEGLTRAVSLIRKAVREAGVDAPCIETIKKRGYRLLLPVAMLAENPPQRTAVAAAPAVPAQVDGGASSRSPSRSLWRFAIAAVTLGGIAVLFLLLRNDEATRSESPSAAVQPAVAVLPFTALTDDDSDDWFGRGIAEELLNALARFPDLTVVARTSAFAQTESDLDGGVIADRLGVTHVVTGSVRRDGERLRISARLLRADDGANLWSRTYEFDAVDVFAVEDEIVREIARTLQVRLGVGAAAGRSAGEGVDPLAYEQYLQGLRYWGDRMRRNSNRFDALAAFQRAVSFDPEFADAWAAIGTVGTFSAGSPLSRDRDAFTKMTEDALERALTLDPDNALAHATQAMFFTTHRIDVEAARTHLRQAQAVAPNSATTHYAAAWIYRAVGDAEAALAAYDRTIALDPLNFVVQRVRAELLIEMGRFEEGMAFFESCFESECLSEGFVVYASAAAVFTDDASYQQRWLPRVTAFERMVESIPDSQKPIVARIMPAFFSVQLQRADAESQIADVRGLFAEQSITDTIGIWGPTFADFLEREAMLATLHRAYERGDLLSSTFALSALYGVNPYPDWLLQHPRYHALWQRPGMPELAAAWRAQGRTAGLPR